MAEYIEREAIKYEQEAFGPYNGPLKIGGAKMDGGAE